MNSALGGSDATEAPRVERRCDAEIVVRQIPRPKCKRSFRDHIPVEQVAARYDDGPACVQVVFELPFPFRSRRFAPSETMTTAECASYVSRPKGNVVTGSASR